MKKTRSQYETWVDTLRITRTIGCLGSWALWGCIVLILLGYLIYDAHTHGLHISLTALQPSASPASVIIVAKNDLPAFTTLTKGMIEIMPDSQGSKSLSSQSAYTIQMEAFYDHITLRPYSQGDKIQLSDLGPKLPATHKYQIRELNASTSLAWIQTGDTLTFTLINTACTTTTNPTVKASPACTSSLPLRDVVVIQVGKASQNGSTALLVAIPLEENTDAIALLDSGGNAVVAYPAATVLSIQTTGTLIVV